MSSEQAMPPSTTRCARCNHPASFHTRGGGLCRSPGCAQGPDGAPCPQFQTPPDAPTATERPAPEALGDAVATLLAALEHASGTAYAPGAARALKTLTTTVPSIRAAVRRRPDRLPERITRACRATPVGNEDPEVAPDADDGPHDRN